MLLFQPRTTRSKRRKKRARCRWKGMDDRFDKENCDGDSENGYKLQELDGNGWNIDKVGWAGVDYVIGFINIKEHWMAVTTDMRNCKIFMFDSMPNLMEKTLEVQLLNQNPSRANEKVGPLVQDLDSVLKGTTYLLSQKWVGVNSILHHMFLAIHSVLPLKWEAYWASDVELPSPMQI
ncbi:Ulp1-like peptidase [Cucumis melo var. makuwa]|uniref:Ulp1-like peptidase n=1 Tax=Cucumis melo var. makuwa TaxID=1194695 RepID=A0A5A7SMJ9_CUCMM|nr:Ulp1-like peptidase [Cucumis melo var. makuwa]TYK17068.1 Ulp1-like peptidase [Cucumis melo var. makuwa]